MAKTTSQIVKENKTKQQAVNRIVDAMKARDTRDGVTLVKNAARTAAVLNKGASTTTNSKKKSELTNAANFFAASHDIQKTSAEKKQDLQKKKEDQQEDKYTVDSLQLKKDQAEKALADFDENKVIDWTDTNQRKAYDAERKRLQDEVDRAGAEIDAREDARTHDTNMERIADMSVEDREQLQQYIESRDARRSVFANPISWYQDYNKETENKNALIDKYGEEELTKLAEIYSRHLHEQNAKKTVEDTQESVNQNWIAAALHNIAAVPARAMGGIEAMAGRLYEQADRTGQYRTLEENTAGDTLSLYGNAVSGQTAQNIAGENGNVVRGALSIGYQGVMSVVDSIARTFFGGGAAGGAALAATNSFTQTVSEATKQGASPQQAVTLGVGKAGIEYLTEKYSIDEVFKFAKTGDTKVWQAAFKQAGVEITTEELTLFSSMAAEAAILREKSSYKQKIGELVANGKSYEEAKAQADNDVWNEALQTAAVSGFAGGLSGGGAAIVGNLTTNNAPEVTEEVQQEPPVQTPPVAPALEPAQQTGPSTEQLLDGIRDMTPAPVPLTEGQRDIMAAMDDALGVRPAQQPAVDMAPEAEYDNSTITVPGAAVGRSDITYTADNKPVQFQYAVVPAESLITSNDQYGNVNSAYPAELQPRDRTRTASQTQINSISRNLNPALLAESPTAQNGAPIIRGDGVVIGGNGRVSAITQAYGVGRGAEYQQFITEKAAELGIDPATLPANPVLVRVTNGVDNYTELANSLNASTTASYSATEAANADASRIGDIIEYLSVSEDGGINTAGNKDFIQKFVAQVVPETERGDVMQANGQLSQAGERRIQNALFAYAYGDTALVERLAESTDNNAKNITNAMVGTAGKVARLQTEIGRGEVQDLGLQSAITNAVNLYLDAKAGKQTVDDAAGQLTMGDNGPEAQHDGLTVNLAKFMEANNRSGKQIRDFIDILVDVNMNMAAETATEVSMFDTGDQQTQEGLYDEAVTAYDQQRDGKGRIPDKSDFSQYRQYQPGELAAGMVGGRAEGNPGTEVSDGRIPQTVPADAPGGQRNLTEQNPGIKGTGAAERNFSGVAAYEDMLEDGNIQKPRPGAVRDVEMPKKDPDGRRVTEFAGNVVSSGVTPDAMADAVKSLVGDKQLSFDTRSNQQSLENAAAAIREEDETAAISSLHTNAENKTIVDGDIEKGLVLYAKYANDPDPESQKTAAQIILDMGTIANMSGRNLQLFSLMKRMTPEGQLATMRKSVGQYIDSINKKRSSGKQIVFNPGAENLNAAKDVAAKNHVTIDEALEHDFVNAKTEEQKKAALDNIYKNVAVQIKPTLGEMWDAWRNLAMLGNLKTHERNAFSTGAFQPFVAVKRKIGSALERVLLDQDQRTKSVIGHTKEAHDLVAWAKKDAKSDNVKKLMGGASTAGDDARNAIQDYRKILPGILDTARKKNLDLMEMEDSFFKRHEYAVSLAGFLKARGYDIKQVQNNLVPKGVLNEGRQYAIKEAQKATFNDRNKLSEGISKLNSIGERFGGSAWHIFSKGAMPFLRTPANVVKRAMEYNPISMANTLLRARKDIKSGRKSAADIIDEVSAGLTGAAAMALGAALAHGMVPGVELVGAIDDEDELRENAQEYSIRIGDEYYSVAWLAPAMIPLFIGANLYNQFSDLDRGADGWDMVQALADVGTDALDPMLELSMLSSLSDIIEKIKYEESAADMAVSAALNAATSYFTQGIPTLFGQIEQASETVKNSTYVNTDNKTERMVKTAVSGATKRLPGDAYQTVKLDEWGEPVENEGDWIERSFNALVNPFTTSTRKTDPLTKELSRLNDALPSENVSPPAPSKTLTYTDKLGNTHADVRLTEEQYQTLARTQGQTAKRILEDLIASKDYAAMPDEQKAKAIQQAYSYARKTAEIATIGDDHTGYDEAWMMELTEGKEAKYIMSKVSTGDLTSAMTALNAAWSKGYNDTNRSNDLKWAYDAFKSMSQSAQNEVKEWATGSTANYIEAREAGIRHKDVVSTYKLLDGIQPEEGYKNARAIQKAEAIAQSATLVEKDKVTLIKQQVSDSQDENIDELNALGYGVSDFVKLYRDHEDYTHGTGKKKRTCQKWQQDYGISYDAAVKLYEVFS